MSDPIDVKALRTRLRLTQEELADRLGLDRTSVSRIENGLQSQRGPVLRLLEQLQAEAGKVTEAPQPEPVS